MRAAFFASCRFGQQQPVLRRDLRGDQLCAHPITLCAQTGSTSCIHGQWAIQPALQSTEVGTIEVVTAGEHRDSGPCLNGPGEDQISQATASMGRNDQVIGTKRHLGKVSLYKQNALLQARPLPAQHGGQGGSTCRDTPVNGQRQRRTVVKEQEDLSQQTVTAGQVNDPSAAEAAAHPPGDFPGLKQFLARQAAGSAHGPSDGIEQSGSGKLREMSFIEPVTRRGVQGCSLADAGKLVEPRREKPVAAGLMLYGQRIAFYDGPLFTKDC